MSAKKQLSLGTEPVRNLLFKLGVPIMLGMLFTALDSIGDAYFVGRLGVSQLSAVLICSPIGQVIVALGLLFGNGAGAYIPRLLGAKDMDKANKVASTALYGSLILGFIAVLLIFINLEMILRALGGTDENISYAMTYARIYVPSLILNIFIVTMNSINSSEGRARLVLVVNVITTILNFALNPICIYIFKMGIAGAAYATVIAQGLATIVLILNMALKNSIFSFKFSKISLDKDILLPMFQVGFSTLIFQLLTSLATTLINMKAKEYGDSMIAGMGAVSRIISLGSLMVFGYIKGFQSIAGFNYGAQKYDRLHEAIKYSVVWSTGFCMVFGFVMILIPTTIISIFTTGDVEMIRIGEKALRANGFSFILFGFYTVYSSLFLALGKTKEGFLLGACRQGICFIPIILILPIIWGTNGIIYAQPISDVLAAVITVFMAVKLHRSLAIAKSDDFQTILW
ncbi:MAG: MATE family efflux transporter [Lachnospiraceae bacterium]